MCVVLVICLSNTVVGIYLIPFCCFKKQKRALVNTYIHMLVFNSLGQSLADTTSKLFGLCCFICLFAIVE